MPPEIRQRRQVAQGVETHLVEEPAAAGVTGAAVGDVGEPDGFFWSSSEDSKDVCPPCLRGKPNDSLREAALVLQKLRRDVRMKL